MSRCAHSVRCDQERCSFVDTAICHRVPRCNVVGRHRWCTSGSWWFAYTEFCGCHIRSEGPFPHEQAAHEKQRQLARPDKHKWSPKLSAVFPTREEAFRAAETLGR